MKNFLECFAGVLFAFLIGAGCVQFSISTDIKITDLISSLSAVATAIIAWVGVNSWREQLKFAANKQLISDLHDEVIRFRDDVRYAHHNVPFENDEVVSVWYDNKIKIIERLMQKIETIENKKLLAGRVDLKFIREALITYKIVINDAARFYDKQSQWDLFKASNNELYRILKDLSKKTSLEF